MAEDLRRTMHCSRPASPRNDTFGVRLDTKSLCTFHDPTPTASRRGATFNFHIQLPIFTFICRPYHFSTILVDLGLLINRRVYFLF